MKRWTAASATVEKMIGLEVYYSDPKIQDDTGTIRTRLAMQVAGEWPTRTARMVLRRSGSELEAVSELAKVWLEKLPAYAAGSSSGREKAYVVELSQLLGTYIFAPDEKRFNTILSAVDTVIARYGRNSLTLLPKYEESWTRPEFGYE